MSHYITGILSDLPRLRRFSSENGLHSPAPLIEDLGFLPLSDGHLDSLFPEQGDFDPAMTYVSTALRAALAELSKGGVLAFIETEYWGGDGTQGATAYRDGVCIMEPQAEGLGPISHALGLLGYRAAEGKSDEFETVGLGRFRNNEDWIEFAESAEEEGLTDRS